MIRYRPEIDGLRAIAVTLVILVHAFPGALPNGFIGVDVFFVISGFLITGILLTQLRSGSFSLVGFYIRRVNRIFPALALVLVACLAFGWLSLFASEYRQLGRSAFSGALFSANINAFLEGGYWDVDAALKPLLHLWSLGVEEQFYLFWPLLLVVVWSQRALLVPALAIVLIGSFAWNLYFIHVDQPATFYLPFSRFWELTAGSLLAVAAGERQQSGGRGAGAWWRGWLAPAGLIVLLVALIVPIPQDRFPGVYAVLPVLATLLIIEGGAEAWTNRRVLGHPVVVYVGLISFPLYMWHYPVLAFATILNNGALSTSMVLGMIVIVSGLSVLTYHVVEKSIRRSTTRKGVVAISLTSILFAVGSAGYFVFAHDGLGSRYASNVEYMAAAKVEPVPTQKMLEIIGDSNAGHLTPGLSPIYGNQFEVIASPGWPYFTGTIYRPGFPRHPSLTASATMTDDVMRKITANPNVDVVVISNQYTMYMGQDLLIGQAAPASETGPMSYENGLGRTVRLLTQAGKNVIVFKSIPPRGDVGSISACSLSALPIPRRRPASCVRLLADVQRERQVYDQALQRSTAGIENVWMFDPLPYLCDAENCYVARDGVMLYGDMSHLSPAGSQIIGLALSQLVERIRSGREPRVSHH